MLEYFYYSLARYIVSCGEDFISSRGLDCQFKSLGSTVSINSLKRVIRGVDTLCIFLTQEEYDKVLKRGKLDDSSLSKIQVISSEKELIDYISSDFGIVEDNEVVEEPVNVVVNRTQIVKEETEEVVEDLVEDVETLEVSSENTEISSENTEIAIVPSEVPSSAKMFIENLKAEVDYLRQQLDNANGNTGVSTEELDSLKDKITSLENDKIQLISTVEGLNSSISELNSEKSTRLNVIKSLEEANSELRQRIVDNQITIDELKLKNMAEVEPFILPSNVKVFIGASSLYSPVYYEHILTKDEDTLVIDLSRESYLDMIVSLKNPVRPTKWLVDETSIQVNLASYIPKREIPIPPGVSIITSPTYVLPLDLFYRVNWNVRLKEASSLAKNVILYLGDINYEGVLPFIKAGNVRVRVLSTGTPLETRFSKMIQLMCDGSQVEDVQVKRGGKDA